MSKISSLSFHACIETASPPSDSYSDNVCGPALLTSEPADTFDSYIRIYSLFLCPVHFLQQSTGLKSGRFGGMNFGPVSLRTAHNSLTDVTVTLCVTSHQVGLHVHTGGMYMYVINCTIMSRTTWTNFCMVHGTAW